MTASRKKRAQNLQLDEIYLDGAQERSGFWTDELQGSRPLSSRKDIAEFEAVQARPANDDGRRLVPRRRHGTAFVGSRRFWMALVSSVGIGIVFILAMGLGSAAALSALFGMPSQYSVFWISLALITAIQWMFALSAHRHAVNNDMLRHILLSTQRFHEPSALVDEAGRKINASFETVFADIDARMALLEEKNAQLANQIEASIHHSAAASEINNANMRGIVDAGELQREALHRTGMMISTEVMPVISKLESTVMSLEAVSQNAGGVLETISGRLQQSTHDLKVCLDGFNSANHTVVPEIEKRMLRFETSIARLPEQLEATIGRLAPMSETIADAALLSTANIEVIDQLTKDISTALDNSRRAFTELSATGAGLFQDAVESHAGRFREMLESIVAEETARVSGLSREIDLLVDTAAAVVNRLQQPVAEVTGAADKAIAGINESLSSVDQRIGANVAASMAELNDVAARIAGSVSHEIETSVLSLQTRLAATSTELMQRVNSDTARFEAIIGETAERSSSRIAAIIKDLPDAVAHRMDAEVSRIDGALKGSLFGLSDQMRQIVDAVPARFSALTQETLHDLQSGLERSFDGVAKRSELLSQDFRRTATETTEAVLQGYVDFIFLSVERFRRELDEVNETFTRGLENRLQPLSNARSQSATAVAQDGTEGADAPSGH
jgi:hypothetical protein